MKFSVVRQGSTDTKESRLQSAGEEFIQALLPLLSCSTKKKLKRCLDSKTSDLLSLEVVDLGDSIKIKLTAQLD